MVEHNCGAVAAGGVAAVGDTKIEPWDWRFYAEKVRQTKYNIDDGEVKPYFPLQSMVEAIFDCAAKLFGLRFVHRPDLVSYHPDVQTYEVREETGADGQHGRLIAVFLHDNYARPNKRSGAWMSEYRTQYYTNDNDDSISGAAGSSNNNKRRVVPVIVNNNNFNKAAPGEATLLSFDDAVTLFHEFGHGLHGMLSDVTYRRLAGTSVLRDFVELPSQLYEHWLSERVVLKRHARHHHTGEAIPDELLDRLMAARSFQQGFATVEYTACALVDVALHQVVAGLDSLSVSQFEKEELARLGMPEGMVMRHRPAHFQRKQSPLLCSRCILSYLSALSCCFDSSWHYLMMGSLYIQTYLLVVAMLRPTMFIYGQRFWMQVIWLRARGTELALTCNVLISSTGWLCPGNPQMVSMRFWKRAIASMARQRHGCGNMCIPRVTQ
jgi:Zn-dependent oligopeptidase